MARAPAVQIEGLKELRAALKSMDPKLAREANMALREAVQPMAADARSDAPHRSGFLEKSVRAGGSARGAFIGARAPYAGVQEYGGTIKFLHKQGEVKITAQPFINPAIERHTDDAIDRVGDALDHLAERHGFR